MAAILSIYGLVIAVIISNGMQEETHLFTGFVHLGAGLAVGVSALAAGFAIGITGDAGVRGSSQQPRLFIGMMLLQIMSEVLGESLHSSYVCVMQADPLIGLYGMVVAMMMLSKTTGVSCGNDV
jgi:V-type H+-transporting ATPase proteolipid subunit